jgi:hypothetical protein
MDKKDVMVLDFLNLCRIKVESIEALDNIIFERDLLLSQDTYNKVREIIPEFKTVFSSSYLNSLHKHADINQKWPLINLLRQILNIYNFKLVPIRKANGYSKNKTKLYKRFFKITKIVTF